MPRPENLCRLCVHSEHTVNLFSSHFPHGELLRGIILQATGIEIQETDVISKAVCQKCCEIMLKLHKYRQIAVANNTLLKEQHNQQDFTPRTENHEALQTSRPDQQITNVGDENRGDLDFLQDTPRINNNNNNSNVSSDVIDTPHMLPVTENHESLQMASREKNHHEITNVDNKNTSNFNCDVPYINDNVTLTSNSNTIDNTAVKKCSAPRRRRLHPSVKKLRKQFETIVLPEKVFRSHVSPVITLDEGEVSDWFQKRANIFQKRLTGLVIKKVTVNSNNDSRLPDTNTSKHISNPGIVRSMPLTSKSRNIKGNSTIVDNDSNTEIITKHELRIVNKEERHEQSNSHDKVSTPTNVACLSNGKTRVRPQQARKRTTQQLHRENEIRMSNADDYPVIPRKMTRFYYHQKTVQVTNKIDVPDELPLDEVQRKALFVSSLELVPANDLPKADDLSCDPLFSRTVKEKSVFLCAYCSKLFYLKRELIRHERIHRTCKFCKKIFKNVTSLNTHRQSCFLVVPKDQPVVKLCQVDTLRSITSKCLMSIQGNPTINEKTCVKNEKLCNSDKTNLTCFESTNLATQTTFKLKTESSDITSATNIVTQPTNVVYISDDSNDEVYCVEEPQHKHKTLETTSKVAASDHQSNIPLKHLTQNHPNDEEIISFLLRKHNYRPSKIDNSVQTSYISNNIISFTKTNEIVLENGFFELFRYKIPIYLESQPKIVAIFKDSPAQSTTEIFECWAHKVCTDITRPVSVNISLSVSGYHNFPSALKNRKYVNSVNTNVPSGCSSSLNFDKPITGYSVTNQSFKSSHLLPSITFGNMSNTSFDPNTGNCLTPPFQNNLDFRNVQNNEHFNLAASNHSNHLPRQIIQSNQITYGNAYAGKNQSHNLPRRVLHSFENQQLNQYCNITTPLESHRSSDMLKPASYFIKSPVYDNAALLVTHDPEFQTRTLY